MEKKILDNVCESEDVDHILAFWVIPSGYWAKQASSKYNIQYSTWALGSDIWSLGRIPLIRSVLKKTLKHSFLSFADGYQLANQVRILSKKDCDFLPSARLFYAPRKCFRKSPPYRLAFLGRWHPNKGVDLLLDSLNFLADEDWEKIDEIRICGGGDLSFQIQESISQLNSRNRPVYKGGYLDKDAAIELLAWADYLLLPSRIESIPVVFSDAMQAGCPVIAMPVGDLPTLLTKNKVGILAQSLSAYGFSEALKEALRKSPNAFSADIGTTAKKFSILTSAQQFLDKVLEK